MSQEMSMPKKESEAVEDTPFFVALCMELKEITSDIRHLNDEINEAKYRIAGPLPVSEHEKVQSAQDCYKEGIQNVIAELEVERGRLRATVQFLNYNF